MPEDVTGGAAEATPSFLSDSIILSQLGQQSTASSLPTETPAVGTQGTGQEETAITSDVAPAASPEAAAAADNVSTTDATDSFALPDEVTEDASPPVATAPETKTSEEPVVKSADSPLEADAPQWQHDAYQRLSEDSEISDTEKQVISKMHPSNWDRMREWNRSHKVLGKFRNSEIPIDKVLEDLSKQSATRYSAMENTVLNRMIDNTEQLVAYAEQHPTEYSRLMVGLIQAQPEIVSQVLSLKGYSLIKDTSADLDVDTFKTELFADEDWLVVEGTGVQDKVEKMLESMKALKQKLAEVEIPSQDKPKEDSVPLEQTPEYQRQQAGMRIVGSWQQDVESGVKAAGIKPATDEERRNHPSAARIKDLAYTVAVYGLQDKIPAWQEQLFSWGEKRDGFTERTEEIRRLLDEGTEAQATSYAKSVAPDAYELGKLRANIGYIKSLYSDAERLMNRLGAASTQPNERPPENISNGGGIEDKTKASNFVSDAIILGIK
jgi:hypothetical protein